MIGGSSWVFGQVTGLVENTAFFPGIEASGPYSAANKRTSPALKNLKDFTLFLRLAFDIIEFGFRYSQIGTTISGYHSRSGERFFKKQYPLFSGKSLGAMI